MDCAKLKAGIRKLEEARKELEAAFLGMRETMEREEVMKAEKQVEQIEEEVLGEFLEVFAEKNEEVFWESEELEPLPDAPLGLKSDVEVILSVGEGEMVVGGKNGTIMAYRKDEDGKWKQAQELEGFNIGSTYGLDILGACVTGDGGIIAGGGYGKMCYYEKKDGRWEVTQSWTLATDPLALMDPRDGINTVRALPDNKVLVVSGVQNQVTAVYKKENGAWVAEEEPVVEEPVAEENQNSVFETVRDNGSGLSEEPRNDGRDEASRENTIPDSRMGVVEKAEWMKGRIGALVGRGEIVTGGRKEGGGQELFCYRRLPITVDVFKEKMGKVIDEWASSIKEEI